MAKILIVDDEEPNRVLMSVVLQRAGHAVRVAEGARDAIRSLIQDPVGLIVTDILMPAGDGLELLTALTRLPVRPRLIVASGGGDFTSGFDPTAGAMKMGAYSKLQKPFTTRELVEAVESALHSSGTH